MTLCPHCDGDVSGTRHNPRCPVAMLCRPHRADRITTVGRCAPLVSLDGGDDDWTTGYVYNDLPLGSDGVNRCDWETINLKSKVGPFGAAVTRDVCNTAHARAERIK